MDIMQGEDLYGDNMDLKETTPVSEQFEAFGVDTKTFMFHSGSYYLIQAGIILYYIVLAIINKVAARKAHLERARKIGMWAYQPNWGSLLVIATKKLYLESYFDLALCSILNLVGLLEV